MIFMGFSLLLNTPDIWLNNNFKHKSRENYIETIENKNVKYKLKYFKIDFCIVFSNKVDKYI